MGMEKYLVVLGGDDGCYLVQHAGMERRHLVLVVRQILSYSEAIVLMGG